MVILVTGANGQLGLSLRKIAPEYPAHSFVFTFVYSIILYAFSKAKEGNTLVSNHMIKHHVLEVIEN